MIHTPTPQMSDIPPGTTYNSYMEYTRQNYHAYTTLCEIRSYTDKICFENAEKNW